MFGNYAATLVGRLKRPNPYANIAGSGQQSLPAYLQQQNQQQGMPYQQAGSGQQALYQPQSVPQQQTVPSPSSTLNAYATPQVGLPPAVTQPIQTSAQVLPQQYSPMFINPNQNYSYLYQNGQNPQVSQYAQYNPYRFLNYGMRF